MASYAKTLETTPSVSGSRLPWATIGWFAALLLVCYSPVLFRLGQQWITDEDMGHGLFVPIIAAYIVWQRRAELAAAKPSTNFFGLLIVLLGAVLMVVGTLGAQVFIARISFLVSLVGAVLFLGGWPILRIVAFPLFLLILMIPIPQIIYSRITLPLQLFASTVAEHVLGLIGIPVLRDGNVLELASQRLSVVEACSGIRSLLALTFLSLIYGYFFDSKVWMRWALLAGVIPIAIAANASRVTLTGVISEYRTDLAQGIFHTMEGWVLFAVDFLLLFLLHKAINRVYHSWTVRHGKAVEHAAV